MEKEIKKNGVIEKMKSNRRYKIGIIVVVFSICYFLAVTFFKVPNENVAYLVLGYVAGLVTNVIGYYFGGNEQKQEEENELQTKTNEK